MILEKVTVFVIFALLMSLLLVVWQQGSFEGMPQLSSLDRAWYWILVIALTMLPITYLTIWPATVLIISAGVVEVLRQQKIDKSGIVDVQLPP